MLEQISTSFQRIYKRIEKVRKAVLSFQKTLRSNDLKNVLT